MNAYQNSDFRLNEIEIFPEEEIFYARLSLSLSSLEVENPKMVARNFKEFSSRIIKVDYSHENGEMRYPWAYR